MENSETQANGPTVEGGIARVETVEQFQAAMEMEGLEEIQIHAEENAVYSINIDSQPLSGAKVSVHSGQVHIYGLAEIKGVYGGGVYAGEAAIIYDVFGGKVVANNGVQIIGVHGGEVSAWESVHIIDVKAGNLVVDGQVKVWVDGKATHNEYYGDVRVGDQLHITGPQGRMIADTVAIHDSTGLILGPEGG